MWGLYEDCSGTCTHNVAGIFDQGHMPVMWNICIPVLQVTLLIAVHSYEVYILTQLCPIYACLLVFYLYEKKCRYYV